MTQDQRVKRTEGHTALGRFVRQPHDCPGWELCVVRQQIQRQETSQRHAFFASLEGREFRPKPLRKDLGSVLDYGARADVISIDAPPTTESKLGSDVAPSGQPYSTRPSLDNLTDLTDSR